MTGGCEEHADDAQRHATHRALQRDESHPAADVHELVHLLEGVLSMTTTPAASAVTSLFCPIAMPTVAAIMAGASLMPSPTKSVLAAAVSLRTMASFSSG